MSCGASAAEKAKMAAQEKKIANLEKTVGELQKTVNEQGAKAQTPATPAPAPQKGKTPSTEPGTKK
jgi:hypothetical protein